MARMALSAAACLAAFALWTSAVAAQGTSMEKAFAGGGTAELQLSAGEYRISGSPDERIRVHWRTQDPDDLSRARVRVDVAGSRAVVTTDGPRNGFSADIRLPRRTHLVLDLSAGDLQIRGLEGNKAVSVRAGDVEIETGRLTTLRHVNASVRIGDLNASPFSVAKGGFFRSFQWDGQGAYDVRAHLTVGDLRLVE